MQHPRMITASASVDIGGTQYSITCGGTFPRFWPPVSREGRASGAGGDTQNLDTCEVHKVSDLVQEADAAVRRSGAGIATIDHRLQNY
jgi:hypothetical protein